MEKECIIDIQGVSKTYQPDTTVPVHAVNGVDIKINLGEFTALVGPSGSGKTTLLNIIGGLDAPTHGSVRVNSVEITQLRANELIDFRLQNIGFVFQAFNLIPVLSAYENIEFIMLLQKASKSEREKRAMELLEAVDLSEKKDVRPSRLSGGQQQRIAVARALASKPKIILADEPTANLDSQSAAKLLDIMEKLNEKEGTTFLFSTHDQRVIERARRVIKLVDGKIVSDSNS
jgi:putative ABC transport system ATP-binding protein